jgi:hypothetical protein
MKLTRIGASPRREWKTNHLLVDELFWKLIDELFSDPISRYKLVQSIGKYYEEDQGSNTVLHLMIYLTSMRKFGIEPSTKPPNETLENDQLYDCTADLVKAFTSEP